MGWMPHTAKVRREDGMSVSACSVLVSAFRIFSSCHLSYRSAGSISIFICICICIDPVPRHDPSLGRVRAHEVWWVSAHVSWKLIRWNIPHLARHATAVLPKMLEAGRRHVDEREGVGVNCSVGFQVKE
jgi:hypothetical protein